MSEEQARVLEAERLGATDERLLALFLTRVEAAHGRKAYQALRRIVTRLRDGRPFTELVVSLLNAEATSRGWR